MTQPEREVSDRWESWRVWFSLHVFTTLQGMAWPVWWKHLKRNWFRVSPSYLIRALLITISSPVNSRFARKDLKVFGPAINTTPIEPPIFLLGHWRSGTTLLQRYFAMDPRFSYPTFYQCVFPRGFLHSQEKNLPKWKNMLPRTRIFDNMENTFEAPAEDEFALCSMTGFSPYMGWSFPRAWSDYDRYLTMDEVPAQERHEWREAFVHFVRKIQYHSGKRVVLKSPPHTCRIRLLLDLFPGAKFVHIHRNPLSVYPSTLKMLTVFLKSTQLQPFDPQGLEERIILTYRLMYERFFSERSLIPAGDYHEIGYEDLEADGEQELESLYRTLALPDFEEVRPVIRQHLDALGRYQKNVFKALPGDLEKTLRRQWRETFEEWPYGANDPATTGAK